MLSLMALMVISFVLYLISHFIIVNIMYSFLYQQGPVIWIVLKQIMKV